MQLKLTLGQIASLIEGNLIGEPFLEIERLWSIRQAQSADLSFVYNPKYLAAVKNCQASALIVSEDSKIDFSNLIRVKDPALAIEKLIDFCANKNPEWPAQIDPSAVIDSNVTIYPNVKIGKNVRIKAGAVIGSDGFGFKKENGCWIKVPQFGSVVIEDDVEIGANTCIDRARIGETRIGRGTKIDNLVQIGHGVYIGEDCLICGCTGISGSVQIGDRVILGGACGIADNLTIASDVTVGVRSVVTRDIEDNGFYWGQGPLPHREALKCEAVYRQLPKLLKNNRLLKESSN